MKADKSVKRVLIVMLGSLGDTIVALPCFHLIARIYPDAERILLTNVPHSPKAPPADSVLGSSGLIHGCIKYEDKKRAGLWRKLFEIRRFKADVVVYLMWIHKPLKAVRKDAFFFKFFSGARQVFGIPQVVEPRRKLNDGSGLYEPEAHRLARMIRDLGDAAPEDISNWDLLLSEDEHARASKHLEILQGRPFIACGPGTKVQAKDWGQQNWRTLLEKLNPAFSGHALVLVGGEGDSPASDFVASGWKGISLNLCGQLTPRDTAAVLCRAELFLGPDSGPMHLAAIGRVPCAIPFSARDYAGVWYPAGDVHQIIYRNVECRQCRLEACVEEKTRCLTSITVDDMAQAALNAFRAGQGANAAGFRVSSETRQ